MYHIYCDLETNRGDELLLLLVGKDVYVIFADALI